jgi:murein endopeptidase
MRSDMLKLLSANRGYFMLPRAPEDAGYYVYGNLHGMPNSGRLAQYAHPGLLSLIFFVEREWQARDDRKFGIGNISIAGGASYDRHQSHRKGTEVDVRPVRTDKLTGQAARVTRFDSAYDREATMLLIGLFAGHPNVSRVYFNDDKVQAALGGLVRSLHGHDDHFHVEITLPKGTT